MTFGTPKFCNNQGVKTIQIGVKKFECTGTTPPHDHPHVFLDMGAAQSIICPYCATVYQYNAELGREETVPADCCLKAS